MDKPILAVVAVGCAIAAVVWGRSARYLRKVELRLEQETGADSDATVLARSQFRKELHTARPLRRAGAGVARRCRSPTGARPTSSTPSSSCPSAMAFVYGRDFIREARLFEGRASIERRAEEVLSQEELAPRRWAERLAPDELPPIARLRHRPHVRARHRPARRRLLRRVPGGRRPGWPS